MSSALGHLPALWSAEEPQVYIMIFELQTLLEQGDGKEPAVLTAEFESCQVHQRGSILNVTHACWS